jgi:hypothetical protein
MWTVPMGLSVPVMDARSLGWATGTDIAEEVITGIVSWCLGARKGRPGVRRYAMM